MNITRARRSAAVRSAAAAALVTVLAACGAQVVTEAVTPPEGHHYPVTRVLDGDTIEVLLADGTSTQRVRLIGIDTPEYRPRTDDGAPDKRTECGGEDAALWLEQQLPMGAVVVLEPDPTQDDTDRYGRLLRYVKLQTPAPGSAGDDAPAQWADAGYLLVRAGLAAEYTYDPAHPAQLARDYSAAQAEAKAEGAGSWSSCGSADG